MALCFASATYAIVEDDTLTPLTPLNDPMLVCGTVTCEADSVNDIDSRDGTTDGYAVFSIYEVGPTGSGLINPFLRFQHNEQTGNGNDTIETAYNTDNDDLQTLSDPYNGKDPDYNYQNQAKDTVAGGWKDGDFNRAILYDDLAVDEDGYVTFLLDINEPEGLDKSTLRLDELSFFISTSNMLDTYDPEWDGENDGGAGGSSACVSDGIHTGDSPGCFTSDNDGHDVNPALATDFTEKVWDMDLDDYIGSVLLDNVNDGTAGSGDYDLMVKLPSYIFDSFVQEHYAAAGGKLYVFLENTAGLADPGTVDGGGEAEAGFEEWAFISGPSEVPVPGTLLLSGLGLMILGLRRRLYS